MSAASQATELNQTTAEIPLPDPFDTEVYFKRWLSDLNPSQRPLASATAEIQASQNSEIFIGSFPGSNCEVSFEGVLHFDGYSIGNINSPDGTLVLTKRGRIEADINVGVAVIAGSVTGDITATGHVVLESEARVTGHIRTPALSVRLGAVFDGDCVLTAPAARMPANGSAANRQTENVKHVAVGAGV